ncbi:3',5'-cyclic-nucleotide phosphodiesterase [Paraglaciecola aquimarina]|uniref:3',5'-cyclic-nucleotide phosphodiesterase n=1 Tax=Paraglaciecola algarum TaxID=3050085 RepID=A0ABS9D869_9ALTE|nr:3',5'-cyclic-nucleotide phosphodiesterase [Paraglaciecola sp. G1-23]MCF2949167.1 3',5'-cyclic-nucleotide phosphodiesterase [Paraglaciecola sp. G1-23]
MKLLTLFILVSLSCQIFANPAPKYVKPAFELITLGDTGGIQDGNLSAFLLRSLSDSNYIALDAGSLVNGINVALHKKAFANITINNDPAWQTNGIILREHVKAYLISHGHLDHVAGMLISSPQDSKKPIYALPSVNQTLLDTYFNWQAWANFTNRGKPPQLNQYQLIDLKPKQATPIKNTSLKVTAFSLSHPLESTAFVIEKGQNMFVYFGDTGPDEVEKQGKLNAIWRYLAKQMPDKTLRGLIIEVSFDNQRPDNLLFGHLTPKWLMAELKQFNILLQPNITLAGTKVVISHIKYSLASGQNPRHKIRQELAQANNLGIEFILAKQGQVLTF